MNVCNRRIKKSPNVLHGTWRLDGGKDKRENISNQDGGKGEQLVFRK